jgi:hypothetical protein
VFKLSCMFLIRLLMRDGGRGFFSGLTCGGMADAAMTLPLDVVVGAPTSDTAGVEGFLDGS